MSQCIEDAFEHRASRRLPRGELWIGSNVFFERGTSDDVNARVDLCRQMGMDFLALPVGAGYCAPSCYRGFGVEDIDIAERSGLFVVAVVSGPFQRLVDRCGLYSALATIGKDLDATRETMCDEAKEMLSLVDKCTGHGARAIVIADDLAYNGGTFVHPRVVDTLISPLHRRLVDAIHDCGTYAVFHSDGDISAILSGVIAAGFDGLSHEPEAVEPFPTIPGYGGSITLLGGLTQRLLQSPSLPPKDEQHFINTVRALHEDGGLILTSSSGIHTSGMLGNLRNLYHRVDEALQHKDQGAVSAHSTGERRWVTTEHP